jgi:uncharacterized membrane protein HdeD (DUF308 family)
VDRKIILWSIALFFGCSILFRAIAALAEDTPKGVSLAIQAAVLVLIVGAIVVINRRRTKK